MLCKSDLNVVLVLHICAKRGLVEMLMRLVQAGADPKIRNNLGQLPEVSLMFILD